MQYTGVGCSPDMTAVLLRNRSHEDTETRGEGLPKTEVMYLQAEACKRFPENWDSRKRQRSVSPDFWRASPHPHYDFGLLAARTVSKSVMLF